MKCLAFIEACKNAGLDVLITCTIRTCEEQNHLYASGRTRKGSILTNLQGGQSKHNFGLAFDFCIMTAGKCDWTNTGAFTQAGIIGENLGLLWAGRWRGKLKELAHFEVNATVTSK